MRKIRVCVDATPLLLRSAGVKTYVYYWTEALRRTAGEDVLTRFPYLDRIGPCDHERSVAPLGSTVAGLALLHLANRTPFPILNHLGKALDVFHASHQLIRPPRNTRLTATLYDMTCWLVPEMHSASNVKVAKRFGEQVLKRSDGLIAISESTRADAVRILGLDPERIQVIYPGVAESFFKVQPPVEGKPYILFVGTIEPRKNVKTLLDAYEQLPAELRSAYDLVIAGSPGWGDPCVVERLRSGIPGVRYLGYVAEDHLPPLTAGATIFVYPSLYEGFGLPVAQAMAAGVPVVTSNVSSLPEVAGDGGLLVDPCSSGELAQALERLLESPDLCRELGDSGRQRAELFHWDGCAQKSWGFFHMVLR